MGNGAILWRRLAAAGHDACRLAKLDAGWELAGCAAFLHSGAPSSLTYRVTSDDQWRTREGVVRGWIGERPIEFRITRSPGDTWTVNGDEVTTVSGMVHLDFAFTPATNLFQVRHAALDVGRAADVPVAWFDVPAGTLEPLHQRYERRTDHEYWYESPRFDYYALLRVNSDGFVTNYPELWAAES